MAFSFEKLVVYQKAVDFADEVCILTEEFTRGYSYLANQVNRGTFHLGQHR
jgi:hypothetical protein